MRSEVETRLGRSWCRSLQPLGWSRRGLWIRFEHVVALIRSNILPGFQYDTKRDPAGSRHQYRMLARLPAMTQVFAGRAAAYRRREAASHQYEMALQRRGITSRGASSGAT